MCRSLRANIPARSSAIVLETSMSSLEGCALHFSGLDYRADGARPDMLALPAGHPRIAATVAPGIPTASAISAIRLPSRRSIKIRSILSRVACMLEVYARTPRNATFLSVKIFTPIRKLLPLYHNRGVPSPGQIPLFIKN